MKGTAKFDNVQRFTPAGEREMSGVDKDSSFLWVRNDDYEALLTELKFERLRLKRAGKMVATMVSTKSACPQRRDVTTRKIRRWHLRVLKAWRDF